MNGRLNPEVRQLNKLQKLKERADKLDIRVWELVAKKEKYQAIWKEGEKLPATWKSIAPARRGGTERSKRIVCRRSGKV